MKLWHFNNDIKQSQLIEVIFELWNVFLETLSLSDTLDEGFGLGTCGKWQVLEKLPVMEHTLWEGLSLSGTSEGSGETEGFGDWKICLNLR